MPRRSERLAQPTAADHADSENGEAVEVAEIFEEDIISGRRIVNDNFWLVDAFYSRQSLINY